MFSNLKLFKQNLAVSTRLNLMNTLVLLSGLLSIFGVYEIQLGAQMHKLNYQHQKYIDGVSNAIAGFESGISGPEKVREQIILVREQPIECLAMIGWMERVVMRILGTEEVINICVDDIIIGNDLLFRLDNYESNKLTKQELILTLKEGLNGFTSHGIRFQPAVEKTVSSVFLIVISVVIVKAILIPVFGFFLSSSVSKDYVLLQDTKNHLLEEQRRNDLIQAERMTALSTTVAGIAHEINTPVGISVTAASHGYDYLEQVEKSYQDETLSEEDLKMFFQNSREAFEIIQNNLIRTSELVKSFKQISVDQTMDEMRAVYVGDYIKDTLISLKPVTKKSSVDINVTCPETLFAEINPGILGQIIINLVTNSIHHAFDPFEGGTINISARVLPGERLNIVFSDDGAGIPVENRAHVFDPFFTTRRGEGGTGLGLHILHNLITNKLNGEIICTSTLGKGTKFEITFPCATCGVESA